MADEDVLGHAQVGVAGDVLVNRRDAPVLAVLRIVNTDWLSIKQDLAFVGLMYAGDDLDEGRLASTVLAHQCMDFARPELEMNILQRPHPREALVDSLEFENELGAFC